MKTIKIKSCYECPLFHFEDNDGLSVDRCQHPNSKPHMIGFENNKIHEDCPLKQQPLKIQVA